MTSWRFETIFGMVCRAISEFFLDITSSPWNSWLLARIVDHHTLNMRCVGRKTDSVMYAVHTGSGSVRRCGGAFGLRVLLNACLCRENHNDEISKLGFKGGDSISSTPAVLPKRRARPLPARSRWRWRLGRRCCCRWPQPSTHTRCWSGRASPSRHMLH